MVPELGIGMSIPMACMHMPFRLTAILCGGIGGIVLSAGTGTMAGDGEALTVAGDMLPDIGTVGIMAIGDIITIIIIMILTGAGEEDVPIMQAAV